MPNPFLSIVIPAYNEESRIELTLSEIVRHLNTKDYQWEILISNDGSTDRTQSVVYHLIETWDAPLRLLNLSHRGKGWAVRHGMLAATGEYRFMADADLAMPIEQLDMFLNHMKMGYDIVIGSRQVSGSKRYREPVLRHCMGRIFNWAVKILAIGEFQDTQCGFKCFRSDIVETLFHSQQINGFGFDPEVLYIAKQLGLSVLEIPITWTHQSSSKVRITRDTFLMLKDILHIGLMRIKRSSQKSE